MGSTNIAILGSGKGSNATEICAYFAKHPSIYVKLLASNRPEKGFYAIADEFNVSVFELQKDREKEFLEKCSELNISWLILAGYLKKIPSSVIETFPNRILNIHPALLPKFGGKGMYGLHVHKAVLQAGEKKSGITIHRVSEEYDEGDIVFQKELPVDDCLNNAEALQSAVQELEHKHFAPVIEKEILKMR